MKTYREFVDKICLQLFEDIKTTLSQRELDMLAKMKKEGGRGYANQIRAALSSRSIRNRPENERARLALSATSKPKSQLKPGEYKRFDKETQTWKSNIT